MYKNCMGTDYHQQAEDDNFKKKICNQFSRRFIAAPPKLIKLIRCGCKSWLHVLMQQVHKLNGNSKSSRINEIQVDD